MVTGLLSATFGSGSGGVEVFGGLWFIVAFFILGFFLLMLISQKVSGENIAFFVLAFFLLVISNGLFEIPVEYIATIIIFIVLFISFYAYNIFNKQD